MTLGHLVKWQNIRISRLQQNRHTGLLRDFSRRISTSYRFAKTQPHSRMPAVFPGRTPADALVPTDRARFASLLALGSS